MTGKMYRARDVMGSMVDEVGDVDAAVNWLMDDWNTRNGASLPIKTTADDTASQTDPDPNAPSNDPDPSAPVNEPEPKDPEDEDANSQTSNHNPMKQYTAIPSAIGEEAMETPGELTLQEFQADALEQAIVASNARIADLEAQLAAAQQQVTSAAETHQAAIAQLNTEHQAAIDALNAEHQTAIDTLNAEHQTAIDALNTEHQTAIDALNAEHATALQTVNDATAAAQQQAATAQQNLADAQQRITDLTAEVESLNNAQGNQPQAGQQPVNNGQQPSAQATIVSSQYAYDPTLSARENAERRKQARK